MNRFRPCRESADFCTTLCPTYCDSYHNKERPYTSCNCTGCFCLCGAGPNGIRDADSNLQCYPYVHSTGASGPDGASTAKPGDKWWTLMTKMDEINSTQRTY